MGDRTQQVRTHLFLLNAECVLLSGTIKPLFIYGNGTFAEHREYKILVKRIDWLVFSYTYGNDSTYCVIIIYTYSQIPKCRIIENTC